MNKKTIFGIILFLLLGFVVITFANPSEEKSKNLEGNNNTSEIENNEVDNDLTNENVIVEDNTNENVVVPNNNNQNLNNVVNDNVEDQVIVNVVDLTNDKLKAIEEIENYNKDVLYSDDNLSKVNDIKNDGKDLVNSADSLDEINKALEDTKKQIDKIEKLKDTKYNVTFIDYNNEVIKTEEVLYGNTIESPVVEDVTVNNITYTFSRWDKDFSKVISDLTIKAIYDVDSVYANVVLDDKNISKVELNLTEEVLSAIREDVNTDITTDEKEIIDISKDSLPILDKQNYKYEFVSLKYDVENGFVIITNEVIDQEELEKNTVNVVYKLDEKLEGYTFINNESIINDSVTTGKYEITELPKVYKDGKEVAVVWTDSNNEVISEVSLNSVNLKTNPTIYTTSVVITATLDNEKPVLTLNGETEIEVEYSSVKEYVEPGYTANDNFLGDITDNVIVSITHNGVSTNKVSYDVEGKYIITYTVVDSEGNKTTKTRTITVVDPIKEVKSDVYLKDDFNKFTKLSEVKLIVSKVRKYIENGKDVVIATKDIDKYVVGGADSLPQLNDKYNSYVFYLLKYENKTFRIECIKVFDHELYKSDKLKELNDLLNRDYSEYKDTKTSNSYNNLLDVINENKNKRFDTIEDIEEAIKDINNAINNLEDIKLLSLNLSRNNDAYSVNDKMNYVKVTAIYNDEVRNRVLTDNEYSVSNNFDSSSVGNKSITYSYNGVSVTYNYTVKYSDRYIYNLIRNVDIEIIHEMKYIHHGKFEKTSYIKFDNLGELEVTNIEIIKNNKVLKTIEYTKEANDKLLISNDNYAHLKNNNTLVNGKIIRISYTLNGQDVYADYYEALDSLYLI